MGVRMSESDKEWTKALIAIVIVVMVIALGIAEAVLNHALAEDLPKPWTVHITKIDDALGRRDVSAAVRAWSDGYSAALGSRHWEGMLDVGDAYLRIGDASGFRKASEPKARQLYLGAFFRARAQRSLDGVLRAARAFAALGDYEVAQQFVRAAEAIAAEARDPHGGARVRAFALELADAMFLASQVGP